jgi:hypothetical protein
MFLNIKYKDCMAKNEDIHNYNTQSKLNLHVNHRNTVLLKKKSVINMGITLYNNVPEQIKSKTNFNSFKRNLKSFLLKQSIYSVDKFMSLKF